MKTKEIDLNKLSEKLEKELYKILHTKFTKDEIIFLSRYVDIFEIFGDAFDDVISEIKQKDEE